MIVKAPFIESDADDTAKALYVLHQLGSNRSVDSMVQKFEVKGHFQTYPAERDASFSANCNVLLALLNQKEVGTYQPQIYKCVKFLTRCWWNTDGPIRDKWVSNRNAIPPFLSILGVLGPMNMKSTDHFGYAESESFVFEHAHGAGAD